MLGTNIRKIRIGKKLTIKEIAETAKITRSLLSQIENNKANPSINSLIAIAKALDEPIGSFFDSPENHTNPVVKSTDRKIIRTQSGISYFLLTPGIESHVMEFLYAVYEKGSSTDKLRRHQGEECGIVIEGRLEVTYEDQKYILETGDSIVLNSTKLHKYTNLYDGRTIAIWVNCPPTW